MAEEVVVGVDVGSSGSRAVAIDRRGGVVATSEAEHLSSPFPLGEADPAEWRKGAVTAISRLGVHPAAIGIGGQGPTTVVANGVRALTLRHPAGATGGMESQPIAQAAALRQIVGSEIVPRQLWDWVAASLGGDGSIQSVWPGSKPLDGFGDPVPVGTAVGVTSADSGLPAGVPLVPGCNDAFMTAWGSAIDTPGKAFDPGGTTGGLGVAVRASEHPAVAAFGMTSHVPGVVIVGGPTAAHGAMMGWWSRITGRPVDELISAAAAVPPGAYGVMVLPFFEGERAPRWNTSLRAEIVGLHLEHGTEVVTRALLESAAYGLAHIARKLADQGVGLDRVVCSGATSRSRLWTEIKAAVLEVPFDVPECEQMASYGAALTAGAGIGWWPRPGEGQPGAWPQPAMTTIAPEPLEVYRVNVDRFIALGDAAEARVG
jgi:sugar (pentulose or hexulose) kinase